MVSRRALLAVLGFAALPAFRLSFADRRQGKPVFTGAQQFDRLLEQAKEGHWERLHIGELVGRVGLALIGTPYVGHTLEGNPDAEACTINLNGLDCVTLFECSLGFARMYLKGGRTPEAMMAEVTFTRYRGGTVTDYTSRLHYTTDWFYDNAHKGSIEIVTNHLPGARPFTQKVGFMSTHPESYVQLKTHPELVPAIGRMESEVNSRQSMYLPMDRIKGAEHLIRTGDIIGVATTEPGIDIAHTGLAYRDSEGLLHFLDASSARSRMKVTLEGELAKAVAWSTDNTGIIVARPLEVRRT